MGSGYRVFTAGEVLTASNVQNYLQDQAVMVFGGTAARSSAIGTANFEEGMLTYLTDVDKLQVYTGAAFADVYPAAASTQGLTLISTTSFSGVASQSFNNVFSSTYDNYRIIINAVATGNTTGHLIRFRLSGTDDSNALYQIQTINADNTGLTGSRLTNQTSCFFGDFIGTDRDFIILDIGSPNLARNTSYVTDQTRRYATTSVSSRKASGGHTSTTQFDGFSYIITGVGITMSGDISVYGVNK